MSLLADTYPDDKERSKAMGLALSGIALGVLSKYGVEFVARFYFYSHSAFGFFF